MNKLHGRVLELFLKDKNNSKISNIVYGKKALDKYVDASFKNRAETDKNKYLKQWDSSKLSNSVYFVYKSSRGKNKQINKTGHRFISNASKKGGYSYLGHLENNNKNYKSFKKRRSVNYRKTHRKKTYLKKQQKGGLLPLCGGPACLIPLGLGAGAVGLGISSSSSSSSSSFKRNGNKTSYNRYESNSMENNGKKKKFELKNNKVYINKREIKPKEKKTIRRALQLYKSLINDCKKKGFQKCLNN